MTDKTVTQADRDRFAEYLEAHGRPATATEMRAGRMDDDDGLLMLARHRLAQSDAQMAAPDALAAEFTAVIEQFNNMLAMRESCDTCTTWSGRTQDIGSLMADNRDTLRKAVKALASLSASNAEKAIRLDERKKIIAEGCIHTRKALVARGDERNDLIAWQTEQCEWFDHVILEIVSEYAAWRDKQEPASNAMRDALETARGNFAHIAEYWNRDRNDMAMFDACHHTIDEAEMAIEQIDAALAGQGTTQDVR